MSEFKVGDKVYFECEVSEKDRSDNTYRLKYKDWTNEYSTTVFVKDDVLYTADELYNQGLNDAWELAKKIVLPEHKGGYTTDELEDIFGKSAFTTLTAQEALARVKAYEEECNEIKVGDVVMMRGGVIESIVTNVSGRKVTRLFGDGSCDSITNKEDLKKIGHFNSIDEFMRS